MDNKLICQVHYENRGKIGKGLKMTGSHEVRGSIPLSSTNNNKGLRRKLKISFLF